MNPGAAPGGRMRTHHVAPEAPRRRGMRPPARPPGRPWTRDGYLERSPQLVRVAQTRRGRGAPRTGPRPMLPARCCLPVASPRRCQLVGPPAAQRTAGPLRVASRAGVLGAPSFRGRSLLLFACVCFSFQTPRLRVRAQAGDGEASRKRLEDSFALPSTMGAGESPDIASAAAVAVVRPGIRRDDATECAALSVTRCRTPALAGEKNVLGTPLEVCGTDPLTGFYRDGCCCTGPQDLGRHVVCSRVSADFLAFSKSRGNDLTSPSPAFGFRGLQPGDRWCLCASRWQEAFVAGCAPPVVLEATSEAALQFVALEDLRAHAVQEG
eukprot:scaffold2871_cov381-Prasinococcus_capsulatus_cf.AAC.8